MIVSARVVALIVAVVLFAICGVAALPAIYKALGYFGLATFAFSFLVP